MITISGLESKQYRITAEGINELQQQLEDLKQQRRDVANEMREITSQSTDLGALEDSTLAINQNQATEVDGQIALLERIIGMAEIIKKPATNDRVQLGSRVTLRLDSKEQTFTIVGPVEADPLEGRISDESPLGEALLGKKVDEKFEVSLPADQHASAIILRIE
jgi:transcription elongation factor GreA